MDQLRTLRLEGMIEALEEQRRDPHIADLDFEPRLALLVQRQWLWKSNQALAAPLQQAQLKLPATLEDIDYRHPRGLKRAQIEQLRVNDWIGQHRACLISGPTGCGKTYLAWALGHGQANSLLVVGNRDKFNTWGIFNMDTGKYKSLGQVKGYGFFLAPGFREYLERLVAR